MSGVPDSLAFAVRTALRYNATIVQSATARAWAYCLSCLPPFPREREGRGTQPLTNDRLESRKSQN